MRNATEATGRPDRSGRLVAPDALRGVGILFVVAIHAFAYLDLPTDGLWAAPWFAVSQIAVPAFFLTDGWLHARKWRRSAAPAEVLAALRASAIRLLCPWVLFSLVYFAIRIAGERHNLVGADPVIPNGWHDVPVALWQGRAAGQLYFLPALFLVRWAAFALHPLVRGRPVLAVLAAAALVLGWRAGLQPFLPGPARGIDPMLAAFGGLGFAAIGWALAELELAGLKRLSPVAAVAAVAVLLAIAGATNLPAVYTSSAAQVSYLLAAWCVANIVPATLLHRGSAWLGRRTMEIFLLHGPIPIKIASALLLKLHVFLPLALGLDVVLATAAALALAAMFRLARLDWIWGGTPNGRPLLARLSPGARQPT